jgi:DNA-binding beta-propeller fold protein YncE
VPDFESGDVFAGHRIDAVAGRGGMGVVYRAIQIDLDRPVALKVIAPHLAQDEAFRERFVAESRTAAAIDHPHVLPIYYAGESDGTLYIAMRYVEGEDLRFLIRREGAVEPARAARMTGQVGGALDAAHARGLVHRDIKPANVLLGTGDHAYLTDFGLTKRLGASTGLSRSGAWVGTLGYVAPEQIRGERIDARADVYALGCVLFHALTGQAPYLRETDEATLWSHLHDPPPPASMLTAGVPEAFDAVIARALAKDPAERHPSAGDLGRAALAAAGAPLPSAAGGRGGGERMVARGPAAPVVGEETAVSPEHEATRVTPRRRSSRLPLIGVVGVLAAAATALALILTANDGTGGGAKGATPPALPVAAAPIAKTIPVPGRPNAVAIGGGRAWVASFNSRRLRVFDATTGKRLKPDVDVGLGTTGLATGFGSLWILNQITGKLRRLSLGVGRGISNPVDISPGPLGLPGHAQVLTTGESGVWAAVRTIRAGIPDRIERVRPNDLPLNVIKTISLPEGAESLAVGYGAAWVVNNQQDTVTRIDLVTGAQTFVPVGHNPRSIALGGGWVWVTNRGPGTVSAIRRSSLEVRTIRVGRFPQGIDVAGGSVWVAGYGDNTLTRIDMRTRKVIGKPITVPLNPKAVAASGHDVWVTSTSDGSVTHVRF